MVRMLPSELYDLKKTIEKTLVEFYDRVFGIYYEPKIEIRHHLNVPAMYSFSDGRIYISVESLNDFRGALSMGLLEEILHLQSFSVHLSIHQLFGYRGIDRTKFDNRKGEEVIATTLGILYYEIGISNVDKIFESIRYYYTPEERLSEINDNIIRTFLDERQLEKARRISILICNYVKGPSIKCSVIKKVGISKFLKDVRKALLDSNMMDDILKIYEEFLPKEMEGLLKEFM